MLMMEIEQKQKSVDREETHQARFVFTFGLLDNSLDVPKE